MAGELVISTSSSTSSIISGVLSLLSSPLLALTNPPTHSHYSRLCSDPAVCRDLTELRGLESLVALVKDGALRNFNDAVLVACLAVLRRVAHHCGHHVFDHLDARDLIDPKLMDSFMEYSSKQESYV